jgi:hypothetical protein
MGQTAASCAVVGVRIGLSRRSDWTNIVIIELAAFDELEAMTDVKPIRSALFESAYPDRARGGVGFFEYLHEHCRTYS